MERYENLGLVGEGSYGMVLKCRHKESNQIVAVKKFIESEDDKMVKKIAMREIRMLKQLRHENLVNLLEVFRRKKRLYLVFEFVDRTVLDDLEKQPDGLDDICVKKISFQVLRGLEFCHSRNIIHRDVKPENILISKSGIIKLCDFGFARTLASGPGEAFTDYVATRWYRAPELLVGDVNYGKAVDIWAVGCLLFEMVTGDPLFPGDSDIDQLFHITKHLGNLTQRHIEIFHRNPLFTGMRLPNVKNPGCLKEYHQLSSAARSLTLKSLALEASERPSCLDMMKHCFYTEGNFSSIFLENLKQKIEKETVVNPLLKSLASHKQVNEEQKKAKEKKHKDPKVTSDAKKKKEVKTVSNNTNTESKNALKQQLKEQSSENLVSNTVRHGCQDVREPIDRSHHGASNMDDQNTELSYERNILQNAVDENYSRTKYMDHESSDVKQISRKLLDMSINMPGKNLPDICNSVNSNRAHGHDVIKHKKSLTKKLHNKQRDHTDLRPMAEKAPTYSDRKKSMDEIVLSDKSKKKEMRRDSNEMKKSGLHLPSVKGLELKSSKTSPSRGGTRKTYLSSIPHIQNIDLFNSPPSLAQESSLGRPDKNGNLPAV